MGKILIVDDEGKMRALLAMALDRKGHMIKDAASVEKALPLLDSFVPEVIITDIRLPGLSGIDLLTSVKKHYPYMEVIVMTAYADAKTGIEAMRNGAFEYIVKPFEMDEMVLLVHQAYEKNRLTKEVAVLRDLVHERYSLKNIVGFSKAMQETIRQVKIVAQRETTVLIRGRSGTGKELVARGIHQESGRKIFLPINCGAIPENLLESELFGHEKGAFTGADSRKIGLFERAGEGTVFLDEIGDITLNLQVKLLRVLQEKEYTRVGGTKVLQTKMRVLAATNRNLEEAVAEGWFREDLYYRLNVFPIRVPSLSDRKEDIPELIDHFILKNHHKAGISNDVVKHLIEYSWPGNVRELENCIERAVIMANNMPLRLEHLPEHIQKNQALKKPSLFEIPDEGISLDEIEKNLIMQALDKANNNKSEAARLLGISRRSIYSKMKTHNLS